MPFNPKSDFNIKNSNKIDINNLSINHTLTKEKYNSEKIDKQ
jgi:hypothetical protein